jgi:anti-sigma factor RsiW
MACEQWGAKLDTYLDGELSTEETRAFDTHVRSCTSCAADVLGRVQLKSLVRTAGKSFTPSPDFRARVVGRKQKRKPVLAWAVASVAAIVLIAASISFIGQQRARRAQVFSELADLHVAALASPNPVDVVSSDRHTVKPWFEGKIPFSFNLPELQNSDFSLVGGRTCYLERTPGAQLIYRIRKHQISVFIFQDRDLPGTLLTGSHTGQQVGFNHESWSDRGLRYFLVGDTGPSDIARLAELLKTAARQ